MQTRIIHFSKVVKGLGLFTLLFLAGCTQSEPGCLPYEGVILPATPCAGDRVIMKVLNKNIGDAYFFGGDSAHNAVSAQFPDTVFAPLVIGKKVYFDYELMDKYEGVICQAVFGGVPGTQIRITKLTYEPCTIETN